MKVRTKASRNTDPSTSHDAETFVNQSGRRDIQQQKVIKLVKDFPCRTASELSSVSDLDRYQIQRRLSDLDGLKVRKDKARRCKKTGRTAVTWRCV